MAIESAAESKQPRGPSETNGMRWVTLVAFAVIVSLGILTVYSRFLGPFEQMGSEHPAVGNELSVLRVEPFIGADRSYTQAELKGHVTLINYWGPWQGNRTLNSFRSKDCIVSLPVNPPRGRWVCSCTEVSHGNRSRSRRFQAF